MQLYELVQAFESDSQYPATLADFHCTIQPATQVTYLWPSMETFKLGSVIMEASPGLRH